nr:immunoglobulin heavy chain junction region [Mus musculus]MBK4196391.1 immunoglobulin heavy chain junction region [Mus musculus]
CARVLLLRAAYYFDYW